MSTSKENSKRRDGLKLFIFGFIFGIITLALFSWIVMPKMMITIHESRYATIDETCDKLKQSIEAHGWSSPMIRDLNATLEKKGVYMKRSVKVVELCKGSYANDVLTTNPEVSTLMSCAWGVYQGDDGKIYISGMNMGFMGKMFGGNIAKVIGGAVAVDEENMLKNIILR